MTEKNALDPSVTVAELEQQYFQFGIATIVTDGKYVQYEKEE